MPWFKLASGFYRSKKLHGLSLATKWACLSLFCVAAEENKAGAINADAVWIAEQLKMPVDELKQHLETLAERGLVKITNVSRTSRVRRTVAPRHLHNEENRTEQNEENKGASALPSLLHLWNDNCSPLPKADEGVKSRTPKMRARLTERPDPAYWEATVKRMAASEFCQSGGWATFDWLIKNDSNHVKAARGDYDNRAAAKRSAGGQSASAWASEKDILKGVMD